MTYTQRQLARHALGLPNKKKMSFRNRFCTGPGSSDWPEWIDMVANGEAVKRDGPCWGGYSMFHLTLNGALPAKDPKENLSPEDVRVMHALVLA